MSDVRLVMEQVDLFRHSDPKSLDQLVRRGRIRSFRKGRRLMHQGDPSDGLYVIVSGRVRVQRVHADLKEPLVLAELGPGEVVGEMGVLDGVPRSATVIALEPTRAIELSPQALQETVLRDPTVADTLLRVLSRRLRTTDELLEHTAREADGRK